ncbi:MAG: hypothetical protein D3924_06160 [Candidatus Electrothrix sp. AR4]|nr:hypothetical protein [Candidatus Electrothrix sp. AR4]
MHPRLSSILATLLLIIGGATALIMLDLISTMHNNKEEKILLFLHRFLGYLFVALFVIMLTGMLFRFATFQGAFSFSLIIHITMALLLAPLIIIKIVTARRSAQFMNRLSPLGTTILGVSFLLVGITTGYYSIYPSDIKYSILPDSDGSIIMKRKCGKCHSLERIYQVAKNKDAWKKTVIRMAKFDYPNINDADITQIVDYLVQRQEK